MQETFNNKHQDSIKRSQSSNERIILNQMNTRTTQIRIQCITIKVLDYINPRNKIDLLKHHKERDKRRNHDKTEGRNGSMKNLQIFPPGFFPPQLSFLSDTSKS